MVECTHYISAVLDQTRQENKQVFETKNLATKGDLEKLKLELQKEIVLATNKIILWNCGIIGAFGIFFLGIFAKAFHWF